MFFLYDFITYSILFVTFSVLFNYVSFIVMAHLFGLFPYYWEQISCYLLIMRYVSYVMFIYYLSLCFIINKLIFHIICKVSDNIWDMQIIWC